MKTGTGEARWLRELERALICPEEAKRACLAGLENGIASLREEKGTLTYGDLTERFGAPGEIAADFSSPADREEALRRTKRRTRVLLCLAVAAAVLLAVLWIGLSLFDPLPRVISVRG